MTSAPLPIPSGHRVAGRLAPPPSKSDTHRALALALVAGRPVIVERPLLAEDTRLFLGVLEGLGWTVDRSRDPAPAPERPSRDRFRLAPPGGGRGGGPAETDLYCGNAGTLFRFLTAILATVPGRHRLDGSPRLRERPVGPLIEALRSLGGRIECPLQEGHAPLVIEGGSLVGGRAAVDAGESSQYLSALLLAALAAPEAVELQVTALTSSPYVDLTLGAMERAGRRSRVRAVDGGYRVEPAGGAEEPFPERLVVEGDWSAACYPAAAAAATGGRVELVGMNPESRQGDRGFLELLERMGARVAWDGDLLRVAGAEPAAAGGDHPAVRLTGVREDLSAMPDQVPTLAALAALARGPSSITDVPHLRIKESDRLHAMAVGLAACGVPVEERPDGLEIGGVGAGLGGEELSMPGGDAGPVVIDPFDDHRIAMSFALLGLVRPGVSIADPGVVAKSYPDFWRDLAALGVPLRADGPS